MYLLVFHAYINEMHGSRSKIHSKKSRPYIYDVKFLALLGAPCIYDISRLRVRESVELRLFSLYGMFWVSLPLPCTGIFCKLAVHSFVSYSNVSISEGCRVNSPAF